MRFVKNDQLKICRLERRQKTSINCLYLLLDKMAIENISIYVFIVYTIYYGICRNHFHLDKTKGTKVTRD